MVVFLAFVAGMVLIVLSSIWWADPKRLTHGADWEGNICGESASVLDKKYMIFCGSPERNGLFPKFVIQGSTACVSACPVDGTGEIACLMPAFHNFTSYRKGTIGALTNVETIEMVLTQSVTNQATYPTEAFGGRFCLPSANDPVGKALRDVIIDGPWGQLYRPMIFFGSMGDYWLLFLISAVTAGVLSWLYMMLLQKYAGVIIFGTMVMSTLLSLALGLFFFLAIIIDTKDYKSLNPINSVYVGEEAKIYSVITGIVIILFSVCIGAFTATSMTHIDECVGLIDAACEPFRMPSSIALSVMPMVQGVSFVAIAAIFIVFGLPRVASFGTLSQSSISVNGIPMDGLQRVWTKEWYQTAAFWYYIVGCFFVLEFYLQLGHFVSAYAISCWYFSPGKMAPNRNADGLLRKADRGIGKRVEVRVAGIDANYGSRHGTIVGDDGTKMLVVPVGKKGPGLGRNEIQEEEYKKDGGVGIGYCTMGFFSAIKHSGSLALGACTIFIFRPFRMASQCVTSFISRSEDSRTGTEDPHTTNIKGCLSLMSACLEQVFGKYSKNAFTELVLSGGGDADGPCASGTQGFLECSQTAFDFLVKSGGSIAHLHGAMLLYEMFGGLFVTLFCGWLIMVLQDKLDMFSEPTSPSYIENKTASAIVSMVVAFAVSFAWMSLWNQTADVLLYCVAWNRRQFHEGEEHKLAHSDLIGEVTSYCPQAVRNILPEHELEPEMEHGLHAHGMGQQGAILAAMEHGAMNDPSGGGGADYSKAAANTYIMATRVVNG